MLTIGNHPLAPQGYEICSNMIRVKEGQRLRIMIQSLDPNCLGKVTSDSIEMILSNQCTPLVQKKLCDDIAPKPFTLMSNASNELLIRFESQTYGERFGYNMTIEKGIICPLK